MIGTKARPKDVVSFMYRKVLFDKKSEVYYITAEQLDEYKKHDIDRIIQDYKDGKSTMRHQIELAELISITYDCFYGVAPTNREMSRNSKFPYIFSKYHSIYEDAWIRDIFNLLNSFKIGKGNWYGYCVFAKRHAIRSVQRHCAREEKYDVMLDEYRIHVESNAYLNHDKFYSSFVQSAAY